MNTELKALLNAKKAEIRTEIKKKKGYLTTTLKSVKIGRNSAPLRD